MKLLIVGGAGFVGSNLAILLKEKHSGYEIICMDNLKRRGSELNLTRLASAKVEFLHGDIRNKEDLELVDRADLIIDASGNPSVMAGITSPVTPVITNNLIGTVNCLELAKKLNASFIFLSTSRVYPIHTIESLGYSETDKRFELQLNGEVKGASNNGITEDFPLEGSRSFYGATKLASEILIQEYHSLLNVKTIINRCSVITGPWQMGKVDQGVVVLWTSRHYWNRDLQYFGYGGEGKQVRDVVHIKDFAELIDYQIEHIDELSGQTYNVGGGMENSVSLNELSYICAEVTGNKLEIKGVEENRIADVRIYVTDNSKVTAATGWKPKLSVKEIVGDINKWIGSNEEDLKNILE